MTKYTKEDCLRLCEQKMNRERCRCESRSLPSSRRGASPVAYGICAGIPEKEDCVKETRARMDEPTTESYCKCYGSCTDVEYYKEVSRSALSDSFRFAKGETNEKRLLSKVVVYYHTFTIENVQSVPKYDLERVMSSFGGINGMYLGVSFFILFRLVETLVRGLTLLRGAKRAPEVSSTPSPPPPPPRVTLNELYRRHLATQYGVRIQRFNQ
ncbi:uncharacterized protein ISCGN_026687 [Ixodes scapularis]